MNSQRTGSRPDATATGQVGTPAAVSAAGQDHANPGQDGTESAGAEDEPAPPDGAPPAPGFRSPPTGTVMAAGGQ